MRKVKKVNVIYAFVYQGIYIYSAKSAKYGHTKKSVEVHVVPKKESEDKKEVYS